jgi:glycerol-1-phosphatase
LSDLPEVSAEAAFLRYEAVRARLPVATFPEASRRVESLADVADSYDAFVLDAFGVLNVGEVPVPGAVARMADLRAQGKRLIVLTNAASYSRGAAVQKFRRLGYDFTADEIISSRDVAVANLPPLGGTWGALAAEGDSFDDLAFHVSDVIGTGDFDAPDGFLFLSTTRWTGALQSRLHAALSHRPRPLVVANPDIVAPRGHDLSLEPGLFAHGLIDALGCDVHWFGKPFPHAFTEAARRLAGIPPARIAMVGDTLHTDVLGGAAAGFGTVLIAAHGIFAGLDAGGYIARSGIRPDVIARTT